MDRLTATLCLLLAASGCEHGAPFGPVDYGSGRPFAGGSPWRITLNLGDDRAPAWLADESGILYSLQRGDRSDHDRCLGLLPPDGGRLRVEVCHRNPEAADSTNVLTEPAADSGGRLAYVVAGSLAFDKAPGYAAVVSATLADPWTVRELRTFPYLAPDGVRHDGASQLRWLAPATLVYLAEHVGYTGAPLDTVRTGADIVRLDLSGPSAVLSVVPGTRDASAVAAGETPDVIYFTLGGDSRVFRGALSTDAVAVVHDFGPAGIARDVAVVGNRLVAVVGGNVSFGFDSALGYNVQRDDGGPLHVVDLTSGADSVLPDSVGRTALRFRRPALSPSGKRLVAEAGDSVADLWRFDLP